MGFEPTEADESLTRFPGGEAVPNDVAGVFGVEREHTDFRLCRRRLDSVIRARAPPSFFPG